MLQVAKSLLRWVQVYPSGLDVDQVLSLHTSAVDELEKADVARTPVNPTFLHCAVQQREQAVSSLHVATPFLLANNRLKCDMLLRCGWRGAVKRLLGEGARRRQPQPGRSAPASIACSYAWRKVLCSPWTW